MVPPLLLPPDVRESPHHAEPLPAEEHHPAAPTPRRRRAERGSQGTTAASTVWAAPGDDGGGKGGGARDEVGGGVARSPVGDDTGRESVSRFFHRGRYLCYLYISIPLYLIIVKEKEFLVHSFFY
jgi:hypothetical protein